MLAALRAADILCKRSYSEYLGPVAEMSATEVTVMRAPHSSSDVLTQTDVVAKVSIINGKTVDYVGFDRWYIMIS